MSAAEAAKFVGVSARTVEKWRAEGKIEAFEGKCGLISAFQYKNGQLQKELDDIKDDADLGLRKAKLIAEVDKERAISLTQNFGYSLLNTPKIPLAQKNIHSLIIL